MKKSVPLQQYGVHISPVASVPDFGLGTPVTEQSILEHLTRAGYADYKAAAAGHFAHAVLTDPRYEDPGSQGSVETGLEGDSYHNGTPIVVDDPVMADGDNDKPPSLAPRA
ncbi:hypothetical protein FA95DRAFT_1610915 [Auriscalpium vulgare]|uniref:Uncharacterized protein n=1 Tax=Auriscalpium vulgare TaxID=40419 RepID=A0ACB8RBM3_9AGAM|nr:hypothetical protein FA95DRAFT_1610915 [Auriscalpium vulgare]